MENLNGTTKMIGMENLNGPIQMINKTNKRDQKKIRKVKTPGKFVKIEISSLSLHDEFLKYEPVTDEEKKLKKRLIKAIRYNELKDFEIPNCDPTVLIKGKEIKKILFEENKIPYVLGTCEWWRNQAKKQGLRLGNEIEYIAFMGVLIKKLIGEGFSISDAWNAVCNDSSEIADVNEEIIPSSYRKYTELKRTGRRCTCGFYDLGNTMKIIDDSQDQNFFWIAGTCLWDFPSPICSMEVFGYKYLNQWIPGTVGWLVRDIK